MNRPFLEIDVTFSRDEFQLRTRWTMADRAVAVFGPSGAGKTTLLHLLAGLRRPSAGRIVLRGRVLDDVREGLHVATHRRRIGMVFQEPRLFPHLDVRRNLEYGRGRGGHPERVDLEAVVDRLELAPLLSRRPDTLSGGESRLVALGRSVLASPEILLLDEPLSGVDSGKKKVVMSFLGHLQTELDLPMLIVSHSMGEVLELTNQVLVLERGQLLAQGDFFEVLQSPRASTLADRLGIENLLRVEIPSSEPEQAIPGTLSGQSVLLPPLLRPAPGSGWVAVRPEDIILSRSRVEGLSAQNCLRASIRETSVIRGKYLIHLDVGQELRAEVTDRSVRELGLVPGAEIFCYIKTFSFRWRSTP